MSEKKIIHEDEVVSFLNSWKNGVINIGKKFTENDDFISEAKNFISQHYNFNESDVLFKPTFTKEIVFRNNPEDALSYFVKGDISEDNGFAIKPWKKIDLLDLYLITENNYCFSMGVLELFPVSNNKNTKIAFTFVLIKDSNNSIKIKVHHSSPIL